MDIAIKFIKTILFLILLIGFIGGFWLGSESKKLIYEQEYTCTKNLTIHK